MLAPLLRRWLLSSGRSLWWTWHLQLCHGWRLLAGSRQIAAGRWAHLRSLRRLSTPMREVESLRPHLRSDATLVDVEHEPSESRICKVEVPHVLECRLINLAIWRTASERIPSA